MQNNYKKVNFNQLDTFYKEKFNNKVIKIPLSINSTCPNRDGFLDTSGCLFCSHKLSGDFTSKGSLEEQFKRYLALISKKWASGLYLPYFQSGSNTYGDYLVLTSYFDQALKLDKKVIGLAIATRYDCISDEMISYLKAKSKDYFIQLEIGIQSIHNDKIELNRYFNKEEFSRIINKFKNSNIHLVIHIINGLPFENKLDMLDTIKYINQFEMIKGVKIHMLNILKDAPLYNIYQKEKFPILSMEQYIDIVISQIRLLRSDIIIHRLTGDGAFNNLVAPLWIKKKFIVLNNINKILWANNYFQGENN